LEAVTDLAGVYAKEHKALKKAHKNPGIVGIPLLEDTSNVADDFKKLFLDWAEAYQSLG
jgi:hypothetical protein